GFIVRNSCSCLESEQKVAGGIEFCAQDDDLIAFASGCCLLRVRIPAMPSLTLQQALDVALQHHQAGRLAEAEALYRQILAVQPEHADAWHFLGVIAHQMGRHDLAIEWINRSLVLNPRYSQAYCNLGEALIGAGRRDEAIAAYHQS